MAPASAIDAVSISGRTLRADGLTYSLANVTRVEKVRTPADGRWARLAAGAAVLLGVVGFVAVINGSVREGVALGFGAAIALAIRSRLRGTESFLARLETSAGSAALLSSRHEGAIDRLIELIRDAMNEPDPAAVHRIDLAAGTVETRTVERQPAERAAAPAEERPYQPHPTRWHRVAADPPAELEEELAGFSKDVRDSFADDDWASERVLMLLESELVSPQPRRRLAENLWKEIRAAAPRTGRLEPAFRRLIDWPRGTLRGASPSRPRDGLAPQR